MPEEMPKILVVDDDESVRGVFERTLTRANCRVETASNGKSAVLKATLQNYEAVVSDISMPGMNGIELLSAIRKEKPDLPIILITGKPHLRTAIQAVEFGAFRYLEKPIKAEVLTKAVFQAVRLHRMAKLKREALKMIDESQLDLGSRNEIVKLFQSGLSGLWMAYQPIVSWKDKEIFSYEALLRTRENSIPNPDHFIKIAEHLGYVHELGRSIRTFLSNMLYKKPLGFPLFVNLHAKDLDDDELFSSDSPFSAFAPNTVLEITERASLQNVSDIKSRISFLRMLGFQIAVDDLGAGYAGLTSLMQLEPDFVKIDRALVQDVDKSSQKQRIIRSMVDLCRDSGIQIITEGVERVGERDMLENLGCDLLQGFLFGKPEESFLPPKF